MALGFMRRHRRWLFVFLWLVIAAFIILYIPAFQGADAGTPGEAVARVGGLPITLGEFQKAYLRQRQIYERLYPGRLDSEALRRLGLEDQALEGLVTERLVVLEARRLGLAVDDRTLARKIAASPGLEENGRFVGAQEYRRRLDLQGLTVGEFEDSVRRGLLMERLRALVTDGVSVTAAEAEREFRRRTEQVRSEYVLVDEGRFRPQLAVDEDEVRAHFESRRDAYRVPEKRVVSYILLDAERLQARVTVTEADLEAYYQDRREDFKEEEQACASHILVKVQADQGAKEGHPEAEARKLAQGLLDQVRAGGDFAALARKASEDQGSAADGGDLGCFIRGRMVPEFENAAFALAPGETSDLVKSGFGYHVIRLNSRREERVPPLLEVKERIRQILLGQRVQALIEEQAQAITASLKRGRGLEEAGRAQGEGVTRSAPLARGERVEPLASPALVARAFEMKKGQVEGEPFLLPRGYAFIALEDIQPPRLPELKEVQDKVRSDLLTEKALEKARILAAELKRRAEGEGLEKAAKALGLVRKETPSLVGRGQPLGDLGSSAVLDEAAQGLPEKTLSDPVPLEGGYAVLRVLEKKPFDPVAFEGQKAELIASLREEKKNQLFQAYLDQARQRFPVERRPEALRRVVG